MAKFTAGVDLNMVLRSGEELVGVAGATHRISDAYVEEFIRDLVPSIPGGVTWITQDETSASLITGAVSVAAETTYGLTASVGTATATYALGDHTHGTPVAIAPATAVVAETSYGAATAVGTSDLYARQDHSHGSAADPTQSGAGFTIPSGSLSVNAASATVALGADVNLYRSAANIWKTNDSLIVAGTITATAVSATVPVVQVYTSSTTWVKPANLTHIIVECQGGGGGGGGTQATGAGAHATAAGGGGGGYTRKLFTAIALSSATSFTITVGAAGSAAASGNNAGGNGGDSSFSGTGITTVTGAGGTGGSGGASSAGNSRAAGGAGGAGSNGDVNVRGSGGAPGYTVGSEVVYPAYGGGSHLGGSARALDSGGTGNPGLAYGGGGGGSVQLTASSGAQAGSAGAAGVVIVTEFYAS